MDFDAIFRVSSCWDYDKEVLFWALNLPEKGSPLRGKIFNW